MLFRSKKDILIKYPIDFDRKKVCTPNMNIATNPLKIATYFAPKIPILVLKKTGKGIPCFWEGLPIKFDKKTINIAAAKVPKKTTEAFNS